MGPFQVSVFIACLNVVFSEVTFRNVVIDQGMVRGYNDEDVGVFSYYGIPYASAPRGEDRFKAPLPPPTWTGVFNATTRNVICPQREMKADSIISLHRTIDCLIVNIFSPVNEEPKLPVLVYIHGGAFQEGYGMTFSPVGFAAKGIVVVNFNYRVGVHGFLCLGTEFAPGNAGLKDQSAALKWVKKNIAQFGGDPDNIMLAGNSAGSMSVELQMLSPMSNGLFHKASSESGSTLTSVAVNLTPLAVAERFASRYGVETGQDVEQLELIYRSFTDEQLNDGYPTVGSDIGFSGCIETHNFTGVDKFLDALPRDIILRGNYQSRPYLTGFTSMEGLQFASVFDTIKPMMEENFVSYLPSDLRFSSERENIEAAEKIKDFYFPSGEITYEGFIEMYTDTEFMYPQFVSARLHANNSVPVYLYLWSFNGTVNLPDVYSSPIWGPGHVAQSLYLMDLYDARIYKNMTSDDYLLRNRIREIYLNFIKFGEPIPSQTRLLDAEWMPMTRSADYYLDINVDITLRQSPSQERMDFWEKLYRSAERN